MIEVKRVAKAKTLSDIEAAQGNKTQGIFYSSLKNIFLLFKHVPI